MSVAALIKVVEQVFTTRGRFRRLVSLAGVVSRDEIEKFDLYYAEKIGFGFRNCMLADTTTCFAQ